MADLAVSVGLAGAEILEAEAAGSVPLGITTVYVAGAAGERGASASAPASMQGKAEHAGLARYFERWGEDWREFPAGIQKEFILQKRADLRAKWKPDAEKIPEKYDLQDMAKELLPNHRIQVCMSHVKKGISVVSGMYSPSRATAYFTGLMVCGSVWVCPVCARRISERKADDLLKFTLDHPDLHPVLVTLTLQHRLDDMLADVLGELLGSWRSASQRKEYKRILEAFGLVGFVRTLECTWGGAFGWHPHLHFLWFSNHRLTDLALAQLKVRLSWLWRGVLEERGGYADADAGVDVRTGDEALAAYLNKWGIVGEVARTPIKKGRRGGYAPFDLLRLVHNGQDWAAPLFQEYAAAFAKRKHCQWSRSLLAIRDGPLLSDEDLADSEELPELPELDVEPDRRIVDIERDEWRKVVKKHMRGELLQRIASGNVERVKEFLLMLGVAAYYYQFGPGP